MRGKPVSYRVLSVLLLGFALAFPRGAGASPGGDTPVSPAFAAAWAEIDQLVEAGKEGEALPRLERLLAAARTAGDEETWTRALVQAARLRADHHAFADTAGFLAGQPRPAGAIYRAVIDLYRAETLVRYLRDASREIAGREEVESSEPLPLTRQTQGEIAAAALAAGRDAWRLRGELGDLPLSRLALYLTPNNYPAEIRGTLRDALSYRFAELLANPDLAAAESAADAESLDLPALLRGDAGPAAGGPLHPFQERAAVLADLEAWHLAAGRREAALEARITRLKGLWDELPDRADRRLIGREIAASLAGFRDVPWWSMRMATLASLEVQEEEPGHLARAHAAAVAGRDAWPGSPGGERCRAIAAEIEKPEFQLMAMTSDGLGRRSLEVRHKNLAAVYFRAYVSAQPPALNVQEASEELAARLRDGGGAPPVAEWRVDLPATPDFDRHSTWVVPPIAQPGIYLIVASSRQDFADAANPLATVRIVLGDLVLVTQAVFPGMAGLALSGATGEPVPGAVLRLVLRNGPPRAAGTTGADGGFQLVDEEGEAFRVLAESPGGPAESVTGYSQVPNSEEEVKVSTLIYTDRAIYRPGQTVLWKVLVLKGSRREARFAGQAGRQVTVTLRDANSQEVGVRTVDTNEFGTAAGEIPIPAGRALGSWWLETSLDHASPEEPKPGTRVQVEEYKRPTFEVFLDDPAAPLRLGTKASLTGRARYYFGLPVTRGQVRWRVVRLSSDAWSRRGEIPEPPRTVAAGSAPAGADGRFEIAFSPRTPPAGRRWPELTYEYRVSAEVTDDGGETREVARSFRLGHAAVAGEIASEGGFLPAGRPAFLTITRRDLDGVPRPGAGAWSLYELRQPGLPRMPADLPAPPSAAGEDGIAPFRTPGDALSPRWGEPEEPEIVLRGWPAGRLLTGGALRHGANGEAEVRLPALRPGAYRLRWETRDADGATVEAQRELIVAGARTPLALPAALALERAQVGVGGTARLLVHSGFPGQAFFLEIWHGDQRRERRLLHGGRSPAVIEIPIRAADRGGLGFRLLLLRDHQLCDLSATLQVPWDDRELRVSFATFRDRLRPGAHETWKIAVRPPAGESPETAAAEVLATMTDRSLELFAHWGAPDPLALYSHDRGRLPYLSRGVGSGRESWVWRLAPAAVPALPELMGDRLLYDPDSETMQVGPLVWAPGISPQRAHGGFTQTIQVVTRAPSLHEMRISTGAAVGAAELALVPDADDPGNPPEGDRERAAPAMPLRGNFAETAFWQPHLLTGADGTATIEFTVPDAVTAWNVFVQAVTRDLRSGTLRKAARSARDLLVRPYLPRFLREGDAARLKAVVTNGGKLPLRGEVTLEITDPETGASLLADFGLDGTAAAARLPFTAAPGGGTSVVFPLTAPRRLGAVAVKVSAVAGDESDGELRPLPVLPSRVHLAQSRFAALHGAERRELRFADLERNDDPTRIDEQLVVTLDGQLFAGALAALPYLSNYPYECAEQTLNRFLSTGIVSSLFARYPAVAAQAAELAKRPTPLPTWDATDPNRRLALEETPFLEAAQGGEEPANGLLQVLDPRIARAQRDDSLAKLGRLQLPSGAFPWWPGGPASPYMTAYVLNGMARAAEFGIELPPELRDTVRKGWAYMAQEHRERSGKDFDLPVRILLNYAATAYPDPSWMGNALTEPERRRTLDAGFAHWTALSPYLRSLLALTLQRMGRPADARRVFDSVMDRARTTADEGTFWPPEPSAWLWSNDPVESHAFALRALLELRPDDPRRHGLVQWLFLNRKLGHWKSTRATAEALYALAHYLQKEGQLGATESATVRAAGRTAAFTFAPDEAGRPRQLIIPGDQLVPARSAVVVEKETPGFLFASATWHFSTEEPPAAGSGDLFHVDRRYFLRVPKGEEKVLQPLAAGALLRPGDEVEVWLTISSRQPAEYVQLRDPRAAGLEPGTEGSGWRWEQDLSAYQETRDSATSFFFEALPAGEHTLKYRLRANLAGDFRVGPATLQSMYAPEFVAYSGAAVIRIGEAP